MCLSISGFSPVMGIILLLGVSVFMTAVFYSSLDLPHLTEPVISFLNIEGKIVPHKTGLGKNSQLIKIYNNGGNSVEVKKLKILVEIYRNNSAIKSETCYGFPVKSFSEARCSGNDIIDKSFLGRDKLGELHENGDGILSPGEYIGFRIKTSEEGIVLKNGDLIVVKIINTENNLIIAEMRRSI